MTDTPAARIAVVTGASAGIGRGAAVQLARRGFGVVLTYRSHPEGADEAVEQIEREGGQAVALPFDIGRTASIPDFVGAVSHRIAAVWGTSEIFALVNNAGFGGGAAFAGITGEHFDRYYNVLLKGPYFLTQALLPLLADGASIVNTSSSSVRPGDTEPGYSAYAAMKGGLITATRYLAKELGPRGIRVNSVAPGPTRTRIADDAFERHPEIIGAIAGRTTLGRLGEPEDIGKVIAFLASDDAGWITGQDIQVSGGYAL
ncbi:SDR family NAD(P)-dependent oxidoreductase [Allonocardiopsis opalescens]|nr:SDR family oxidoreductase [Allonocardiopsis opalescens]